MPYPVIVDDNDIDDAALWAVIDSAAASHSSSKSKTLPTITYPNQRQSPSPVSKPSPSPVSSLPPGKFHRISRDSGEVVQESWAYRPPRKVARIAAPPEANVSGSPLAMVRTVERTPPTKAYASPESYLSPGIGKLTGQEVSGSCTELSPQCFGGGGRRSEKVDEEKENGMWHGLSGRFPSVSLFKEYQNAAMAILEKTDYTLISGKSFIKKTGWRKISCYFNISYEIRDKNIEFDENRNVQRAEFVVRAYMQGGRFSDGWGSCERCEKRFQKPNHDIPSTAETRAKNKACQLSDQLRPQTSSTLLLLQDLLGIGEYRPGATSQVH
ncbi:uncharacterized protein LOC107630017 isoform X3 [Arachis ipaensis]|uniref:uncharacterized protein LOC107630017 isoform X3 n=1 Tax=Arachis ipaensis TaxID=130454 RepID=UPI000A2B51B9|nr:uncharacterized protein LOC107630017 isoform X3 [Arachis ipaensis]